MSINSEISIFCGGRGSNTIIQGLLKNKFKKINLLINTYDDGLSTGAIRKLLKGMGGPSDIRKNVVNYLKFYEKNLIANFLEYRLSEKETLEKLYDELKNKKNISSPALSSLHLLPLSDNIKTKIINYMLIFFQSIKVNDVNISNFAIGNIIYAGIYVQTRNNQQTIKIFQQLFIDNPSFNIISVSNGSCPYLCALKEKGEFLYDENSIVNKQTSSKIVELFLLYEPLTSQQKNEIQNSINKIQILQNMHKAPFISKEARNALTNSDIIIYGPGTQHSSLFPSYMTTGINNIIKNNKKAIKIFIANILKDHDIQSCSLNDIINSYKYFIGCLDNIDDFIDYIFFSPNNTQNGVIASTDFFDNYKHKCILGDYINTPQGLVHDGERLVNKILKIKSKTYSYRNLRLLEPKILSA